jgi:cell division protein FtsB
VCEGLEASVQTLQKKLERSERKLSVADIEKNRLQKERDNVATQLAVAFQNFDELKREKEALNAENDTLRQEIDALRAENDTLRDQLEHEQEQYREETLQLRRQVDRAENVTVRENETLRHELTRVRAQHDENTQTLARKDAELRRARKEQAEYAKLKADNELIKEQLAELKAKREQEMRRWSTRESELKGRVERRDETIRHFQDMTQEQTNEAMRLDNNNLRQELAQLASQHEEEARRWSKKEDQLRRKVDAAREKEGLTREILSIRQANGQWINAPAPISADKENRHAASITRKPSHRREDTRTRIATRVQQEVRNSRPMSSSHAASEIERSPRKSYTKTLSSGHRASLPADYSRSFSAPVSKGKHAEVESEIESTTDLSLAPRGTPYVIRGSKTGVPFTTTVEPPAPLELTELSFINTEDIAALRRQLEEERAGVRTSRAASAPLERQAREDTIRSVTSVKSKREQSLPRKSSMKDVTERTNGTVFEDVTGRVSIHDFAADEQTQQTGVDASMLSNTSRRRRSAPIENMTSAFILPDIKLGSRKEGTTKFDTTHNIDSRAHDNSNCTVCRREGTTSTSKPLSVPKLIPVSSRMPDDIDATLRPARSPKEALALVVKELLDERAHLHIELAVCRASLETHDPSQGMRKRHELNAHIQDLLRQIEVKDTQIYHLYDVLEGQDENEITEQDVEELTRDIRIPNEQPTSPTKKKEKRVVVQSFHGSEDDGIGATGAEESDEELPWEGFEDTQDLDLASSHIDYGGLNNVVMGRRGSVY